MTPPSRKHALEAELREIKRFEKEDRAANPKVVGTPGEGTPRRQFSGLEKHTLLHFQAWRCARCAGQLLGETVEFDHVLPLELGGDHDVQNAQALCVPCHKAKTKRDIARIAKARRQANLMQPKEPSKRPLQSRNTFR